MKAFLSLMSVIFSSWLLEDVDHLPVGHVSHRQESYRKGHAVGYLVSHQIFFCLSVTLSVTLLVTYIVTDMAGMKAKWPTKVIKIPAWRHFHNFWLILPSCPAPTCQSVNIWRQSVNWLCLHEGIFITILPSSWSPTCLSVCQWKQNGRHEGIFINFFH